MSPEWGDLLLKIALYGKLSTSYCDRRAPKKRFKDSLKKTLSTCHIDHYQWSTLTVDRQAWPRSVHQVVEPTSGRNAAETDPGTLNSHIRPDL